MAWTEGGGRPETLYVWNLGAEGARHMVNVLNVTAHAGMKWSSATSDLNLIVWRQTSGEFAVDMRTGIADRQHGVLQNGLLRLGDWLFTTLDLEIGQLLFLEAALRARKAS